MEETDDRRGSGRVNVMIPATLEWNDGRTEATALDVSTTGMSVWGPESAPSGPIRVTFDLGDGQTLQLEASISRVYESDGGSVWGMAFEAMDAPTRRKLEQFVATWAV